MGERRRKILTKDSLKNFGLQWKLHLDNEPKELISLTAPVVVEDVYTAKGVKDVVVVAGSSDNLYAIDADSGKLMWQKNFTVEVKPKQKPHWLCPNGLNDTPLLQKEDGRPGNDERVPDRERRQAACAERDRRRGPLSRQRSLSRRFRRTGA